MNEPKRISVPLHKYQSQFRRSTAPYRGFVAGRGGGKTWVGAYDLAMRASEGPGRGFRYSVVSPTFSVLEETTLITFIEICKKLQIYNPASVRKSPHPSVTLPGGSHVVFRSGEDPEKLRGGTYAGVWLDEASLMKKEVFDISIASLRARMKGDWLSATFTPKGRQHWTYEKFGAKNDPNVFLVQCSTSANCFISEDFEAQVRSQYTSQFASQELGGEFVDLQGGMVQRGWFEVVQNGPAVARRVRAWDKASTEDGGCFTAGVLISRMESGIYFIEHVIRGQWSSHQRNEVILSTAHADKERYGAVETLVEQEPGSGGKESAEFTIKQLAGFPVYAERPTGDKTFRFQPFAAQAEARNIKLIAGPWNKDYLDEISAFPLSVYKDQADATSAAFNRLALVTKKKFWMYVGEPKDPG